MNVLSHVGRVTNVKVPRVQQPSRSAVLALLLGGFVSVAGCSGAAALPSPTAAPTSASPSPAPTPTATLAPTPAPTTVPAASPMPRGGLEPGTYVTTPLDGAPLAWQITVPRGWTNGHDWFLFPTSQGSAEGPDLGGGKRNGVAVAFLNVPEVVLDPCDFDGPLSDTDMVPELVAAIQARDDWVVSTPVDVTIGRFSGQRVDIRLPADVSVCGEDAWLSVFREPGTDNGYPQLGPSNQLRAWILDVGGRIVILQRESYPGSPAQELAEAQQIIESSVITP